MGAFPSLALMLEPHLRPKRKRRFAFPSGTVSRRLAKSLIIYLQPSVIRKASNYRSMVSASELIRYIDPHLAHPPLIGLPSEDNLVRKT